MSKQTCNWYNGPTLLQTLDDIQLEKRYPNGPLRIPILDKMKDSNLIVHGKVENGTVKLGDKLAIMPSGAPAQVLTLYDAKGDQVPYACPGENIQIKINMNSRACNFDSSTPNFRKIGIPQLRPMYDGNS